MTEVEIAGALSLEVKLEQTPKRITTKLIPGMVTVGLGLVNHLKTDELSGQALGVRTGTGRRSVTYRVYAGNDNDVTVEAGPDLSKARYMRAQDAGATILPKRAGNLTIPIGEALTGKGVARFTARQLIDQPASFGYVGTFVHNRVIFGKRANGNIVPLFVLKSSVRLKAVGFMAHTLSEKREWAHGVINAAIAEGMK